MDEGRETNDKLRNTKLMEDVPVCAAGAVFDCLHQFDIVVVIVVF